MKKSFTSFLNICFLVAVGLCNAQLPMHLKKIPAQFPTTLSFELALPTKDTSVLIFGNIGNAGMITKVDSAGNLKWSKSYYLSNSPNANNTKFMDATLCHDSSFAAVGTMSNTSNSVGSGFFIKFKPNGDTLWCRRLADNNLLSIVPYSVNQTLDSGFVVCGVAISSPTSGPNQHAFVAKITKAGTLNWFKTYSYSFYASSGQTIKQTPDSGFILIGGIQYSAATYWCTMVAKLDKTGNPVWSNKYQDATQLAFGLDIVIEPKGYLGLTCSSKPCLLRIDSSGTLNWVKSYNTSASLSQQHKRDMNLRRISGGKNLIVGKSSGSWGSWSIVTDSIGNVQWDTYSYMENVDVVQYKNKNFIHSGNPSPNVVKNKTLLPSFGSVGYVITDSLGNGSAGCYSKGITSSGTLSFTTTAFTFSTTIVGNLTAMQPTASVMNLNANEGCADFPSGISENDPLETRIFPNPSTGKITISSNNIAGKKLRFEVSDLSGKQVKSAEYVTENDILEIELDNLTGSVYMYCLIVNNDPVKQGKLVIIK
jgi:hypothetical protein